MQTEVMLSVDGSLSLSLADKVLLAGADVIVSGSAIFKNGETNSNLQKWHQLL